MRFRLLQFVACAVLVNCAGQGSGQENKVELSATAPGQDASVAPGKGVDKKPTLDEAELQKQIDKLQESIKKLAGEKAALHEELVRLLQGEINKLKLAMMEFLDQGAIGQLDVVDGKLRGFVVERLLVNSLEQRRGAPQMGPFRPDSREVCLGMAARIKFADGRAAAATDLKVGQWVRLKTKITEFGKFGEATTFEAQEVVIDRTVRRIAGTFGVHDLIKQVDFTSEDVVLFDWIGEADNKLLFRLTGDKDRPVVDFERFHSLEGERRWGSAKGKRPHGAYYIAPMHFAHVFVVARNVEHRSAMTFTGAAPIPSTAPFSGKRFSKAEDLAKALTLEGTITLPDGQKGTDALHPRGGKETFFLFLRSERPKDINEIFEQGLVNDRSAFVDRPIMVGKDTHVLLKDKSSARLEDLKLGDVVEIRRKIVDHVDTGEGFQADQVIIVRRAARKP